MASLDYLTDTQSHGPNPTVRPTWHCATITTAMHRLRNDGHGTPLTDGMQLADAHTHRLVTVTVCYEKAPS